MNQEVSMPTFQGSDTTLSIRELFLIAWSAKWLLLGAVVASAVLAIVIALYLPNIYRAEALLAPNNAQLAGVPSMAGRFGALADLAGLSLPSEPGDKISLGLEVIKSRRFLTDFIERRELLIPLMGVKGWDQHSESLIIDPSLYDEVNGNWIRRVRPPRKARPSSQEAVEAFLELLSITRNVDNGFVVIAIEHYSPEVARSWVDWIVEDLNDEMRRKDRQEAEQAVEYLTKQLESTSIASLQPVLSSLIEEHIKTLTLAAAAPQYLFQTIDPAVVPEEKERPKRGILVVGGALAGGLAALIWLFFREGGRASRGSDKPDEIKSP